jgi:hypothetical protein
VRPKRRGATADHLSSTRFTRQQPFRGEAIMNRR